MSAHDFVLDLRDCTDHSLAGGKAVNLARLIRAQLPVPAGFVVTTEAYRLARRSGSEYLPADVADSVRCYYRQLGSPPVAVRSSATAEDMAGASMAGQYDTFLDIEGEESLLCAIHRCWASLVTGRTSTYMKAHGIDLSLVAMAVIVQRLVPADVAGVLFTANPHTGERNEMLIEASWGLGEAVVSGLVQPDVLRVDAATGSVTEAVIGDKQVCILPGRRAESPVDEARRRAPCLNARDVLRLWDLGRRAAEHFGSPQDIEWAIAAGEVILLQSRPITTLESAEAYTQCLDSTKTRLRAALARGQGPWVTHNLAETLPHPMPLTWSLMRRFMSGSGGFGAMYRQIGFAPSREVSDEGFLTLIAGRVYMDLAAAPGLFFEGFPFAYDPEDLRRNPDAAQAPPSLPHGSLAARLRAARRLSAANRALRALAADFDQTLAGEIIPTFQAWCREQKGMDLRDLDSNALLDLWQQREKRVLDEFAPQSLLPGMICGMALADLREFLDQNFWNEEPDELLKELAVSTEPDSTIAASAGLYAVARGEMPLEQWLVAHGHRAPAEFELATPRWRERPVDAMAMAAHLEAGRSPGSIHEARAEQARQCADRLRKSLTDRARGEFSRRMGLVQRYLRFREDGKYYLMLGYDLLRDTALEAGRRLGIGDDVFLLTFDEMRAALRTGYPPLQRIEQRRLVHAVEEKLALPGLISTTELERLGVQDTGAGTDRHAAFAASSGAGRGPVRIVRSPEMAGELGQGYVLVCPSTDPSWTPLFVNAAALVLERGGTLSHGAVVARELGIPAVVLPGATRLLQDGETVTVDGSNGVLWRGEAAETDSQDARPERTLIPPATGPRENSSATLRNAAVSVLLLAGFIWLPDNWVRQPVFALLDRLLWPVVRVLGRPLTVAAIACFFAALTMAGQRLFTDNSRLREAKRRANRLKREAARLPKDSPRRAALMRLAGPVQYRITMAGLVPLAALLAPMVAVFCWLPARMDPASWNAEPGSPVNLIATVNSDWRQPVTLHVQAPLHLDPTSNPAQQLPRIRETLESLYAKWAAPSDVSQLPWELQEASRRVRVERRVDLAAYLKAGVPPQKLAWRVRTPMGLSGRFPLLLDSPGQRAVLIDAVLGDHDPPGLAEFVNRDSASPIRSVRLVYATPDHRRVFWAPLAAFGRPDWDAGWLIVYLLSYLPAMLLARRILRVA